MATRSSCCWPEKLEVEGARKTNDSKRVETKKKRRLVGDGANGPILNAVDSVLLGSVSSVFGGDLVMT